MHITDHCTEAKTETIITTDPTAHLKGDHNAITDIPSRSFGSNPEGHFKTHAELLTFFNARFPLPQQTY